MPWRRHVGSLRPSSLPPIPGLDVAVRFRAAGESHQIGGDFYDLFVVEGGWFLILGDVTGKGPGAAEIAVIARDAVHGLALEIREPARILHRLNDVLLAESGATRRLCTAVCMRIEADGKHAPHILAASAGHPLPVQVDLDGTLTEVCEPGPLLGAFDTAGWKTSELVLAAGASLVLYTDGVTDTSGIAGRFGIDRLRDVLAEAAGRDADAVAASVDEELLAFQDGPQDDDVALLVLRSVTA